MSLHRRQKKREICENLSKVGTEMKIIQKTSSEADFYQIWLDLGVSRRAQKHQKLIKKQVEKTAKKSEKRVGDDLHGGMRRPWGGYRRGKEDFQDSQKRCKKLKTEMEAKN